MTKTKSCPYCGETIKSVAIKCRYCASMLAETSSSSWQDYDTMIRSALTSKYEIIEEVGKGGMAIVYKAIQKNLKREIALKVIHPNLVHDAEFLSRFHYEAQIAASLNHPNIVKIYDEGESKGVHYMAMEYLDGEDLHKIIRSQGRLTVSEALSSIKPIALALFDIHSKGLIHRDIKSSNIFITRDGRPVLTDFGIARASDGPKMTQLGAVFGTPEYMSPEQAEGVPLDHRSDLYSLGIVLYECMTGYVPFKADTPLLTINKVLSGEFVPPAHINKELPGWLNGLLIGLLRKDPDQRLADNGHSFAKLLEGKELIPQTFKKESRKTPKRKKVSKPVKQQKPVKQPRVKSRRFPSRESQTPLVWALMGIVGIIIVLVVILAVQTLDTTTPEEETPLEETYRAPTTPPAVTQPIPIKQQPAEVSSPQPFTEPQIVHETVKKIDTIRPSYRGGLAAIRQHIAKYINNSPSRSTCTATGRIKVLVMVNTNGKSTIVRTTRGIQPECDGLVMEAIENLPSNWVVGKIDGSPTRMGYSISYTIR